MTTLTNRKDARDAGHRFYLPDVPCRNGHSAPRYVSTGHCTACLAASRGADQEAHRQAMAARFSGGRQFTYPLHPDDHAAALAFCQALDLQRGRQPHVPAPVAAPPAAGPGQFQLPEWLQQARQGLAVTALRGVEPAAADHIPAEFARLPTNGS